MIAAIIDEALSLDEAIGAVSHAGAGALVTFEGVVRDHSRDLSRQLRRVEYLEYEAYRPMAEREMARVVGEVEARWDVRCAASHRIGKLHVGETAVVVAVSSSHRSEAFEACRYAIDRIKETVPIWKKEVSQDGFWWVENPVSSVAPIVSAPTVAVAPTAPVAKGEVAKVASSNFASNPAFEQQSANTKGVEARA